MHANVPSDGTQGLNQTSTAINLTILAIVCHYLFSFIGFAMKSDKGGACYDT